MDLTLCDSNVIGDDISLNCWSDEIPVDINSVASSFTPVEFRLSA